MESGGEAEVSLSVLYLFFISVSNLLITGPDIFKLIPFRLFIAKQDWPENVCLPRFSRSFL